jgi:hypothetical protein
MTFAKVFVRARIGRALSLWSPRARKRHKKEFLPLASAAKPALPSPACDAVPQKSSSWNSYRIFFGWPIMTRYSKYCRL